MDFSVQECSQCNAKWIGGQLFWSTGKEGCPHDLAGLVCNNLGDETCINPCVGMEGGVTWEKRMSQLEEDESQNG